MANQKNINVSIMNLVMQVGQLAKQLQNSFVAFSTKVNCNAITTWSRLVIPNKVAEKKKDEAAKKEKD